MMGFTRGIDEVGGLVKFSKYDFRIDYMPNSVESPQGRRADYRAVRRRIPVLRAELSCDALPRTTTPATGEYVSITEGRYENNVTLERQLNGDEFRIMFREKPSVLRCCFLRCRQRPA